MLSMGVDSEKCQARSALISSFVTICRWWGAWRTVRPPPQRVSGNAEVAMKTPPGFSMAAA